MIKETAIKITKGEKTATQLNRAGEPLGRPNASNREPVRFNAVDAHGVTNPDFTKDQTTRSHELATDA
jgi:hypothetical protein